jgi:hypothetical protein
MGQFVAPRVEKSGRFAYQLEHLMEISKRLQGAGLDDGRSELWLRLAEQHLHARESLDERRRSRVGPVLHDYMGADGYRRFSLGAAAALSDVTR